MATNDAVIDGLTINAKVVHPKVDHAALDKQEINDLCAWLTAKHHTLFDLIALTINS
jgi:hypothetical protein